MRVLLSTWGSRGDVEPLLGFAVALKELGAEARARATAVAATIRSDGATVAATLLLDTIRQGV